MDTPGALAGVFELVTAANSAADAGDEAEGERLAETAALLLAALGVPLRAVERVEVDEESARLVAEHGRSPGGQGFCPG